MSQAKPLRLVPVVLAALLALTGCDQSTGTAARVGGDTISTKDVDLVSQALCQERSNAASAQDDTRVSVQLVHRQAVQALVDSVLSEQYAAKENALYDRAALNSQIASIKPLIHKLPAADQNRTQELIGDIFKGRLQLTELGERQLELGGQKPTSAQQALTAGLKLRAAYDKTVHVALNPRYDTDGPGHGGDGSQSLSKGVSSYAKDGASSTQDPVWTAALPGNLRCG